MPVFEAYPPAYRWRWPCLRSRWLRRRAALAGQAPAAESYAIAMHGAPALPADFTHMPYANPDAPKGGRLV